VRRGVYSESRCERAVVVDSGNVVLTARAPMCRRQNGAMEVRIRRGFAVAIVCTPSNLAHTGAHTHVEGAVFPPDSGVVCRLASSTILPLANRLVILMLRDATNASAVSHDDGGVVRQQPTGQTAEPN
jgi:hypothetical protein